jgi:GMP synthase-like glutamine amidotransferase
MMSSVVRSLLVVQNDSDKPLGRLLDGLARAGVELDVRSPADALPAVRRYAGLIVLPGLADPVDRTVAVDRVRGSIDDALQAELPVLGICLGGQLLVEALGGSVYPSRPETGFREVAAATAASSDPLLEGVPQRFLIFHAHAYAFRPPADAEILLTNEVCVQACRTGQTWAFQCHPETSPEWVQALAAGLRGRNGGLPPATVNFFACNGVAADQLERDAASAGSTLSSIAAGIASGFAAQLD